MKTKIETIHMTPADLQSTAIDIWGKDKWRGQFQDVLGISYSQLHRYMTVYKGQQIPRIVAMSMAMLKALKDADIDMPTLPDYKAADLVPVKFVWEKKPKPVRIDNDAPEEDFFGTAPKASAAAKVETAPAPEPEKPQAAAPEPEKVPAKKPDRKKAVAKSGPEKAGPDKVPTKVPAKKPSLAKASRMLGELMPQPKKRTAKKKA